MAKIKTTMLHKYIYISPLMLLLKRLNYIINITAGNNWFARFRIIKMILLSARYSFALDLFYLHAFIPVKRFAKLVVKEIKAE